MEALSNSSSSLDQKIIPHYLQQSVTRKFLENINLEDTWPDPWKPAKYFDHGSNSSTCLTRSKSKPESDPKEDCGNVPATTPHLTSYLPHTLMSDNMANCTQAKSQQEPSCFSPHVVKNISGTPNKLQDKMVTPDSEFAAHLPGFSGDTFIIDHNHCDNKSCSSKKHEDLISPFRPFQNGCIASNDIGLDPQMSTLKFMEDVKHYAHTEVKSVEDILTLHTDVSEHFDNREKNITKYLMNRSGLDAVHEENILGNGQTWKGFMNIPIMLDDEDVAMSQCVPALDEGLYSDLIQQHGDSAAPNIAKLYRVFVAGEHSISDEEVITNKDMMHAALNICIVDVVLKKGLKATRLQAYTWPVIAKGSSVVIVGEKSCGKTMGYVVPLLSNILDSWKLTKERLPPGVGPMMVVVCSTWRSAKCVADYIVKFLPASVPFKVMTAWGGCGGEEEMSTGKQLLSGCDILITTTPCLLRLLQDNHLGIATTLKRCCHLVFDDVDIILEHFSLEVKQIITIWGKERRKSGRPDTELQAVLVSSRWTKLLNELTETLLPLLQPLIIISAPCEAAIATKVASHIDFVSNETEALNQVMKLINTSYIHKRIMVFVSNDNLVEILESMMKNAGMLCVIVDSTTQMWKIQQLVHEWHTMQGMTMIVSHDAEGSLLHHDLANAEVLFHTHLGAPLTTFTYRYSFMSANFVTDLSQKSTNCESHLILSKYTLKNLTGVLEELYRICGSPKDIKATEALVYNGRNSKDTALCYYLKAYGRCCRRPVCSFRHEVQMFDIPQYVPRCGEVTFKVKKSLGASRYLVHLIQYREEAGAACIDLSSSYSILYMAIQNHFTDAAHCKPLKKAEPGMLCAIQDNGAWNRAQIICVNYKETTTQISVFLVDEGKQVTVSLESAQVLPSYLTAVPQLVVEVLLCRVQPKDQDHEWTLQASSFVYNLFAKRKDSTFIGRIILALGSTLWLNPVAEFIKIGKTFVQKKALRERLLSEKFGVDNPTHIKNIEHLCVKAGVSLEPEATCDQTWRKTLTETLERLQAGGVVEHSCNNTSNDHEANSEGHSEKSHNIDEQNDHVIESITNVLNSAFQGEQALLPQHQDKQTGFFITTNELALLQEELPLNQSTKVEIAEVVSPKEFFIIKANKVEE